MAHNNMPVDMTIMHQTNGVDPSIIDQARAVLNFMATSGNAASKDHEKMVAEIEASWSSFSSSIVGASPSNYHGGENTQSGLADWCSLLDPSTTDFSVQEFLSQWARTGE
jgi:hypothetical protein